ncbi:sugar ABC transporter permease [Vallitalea pronyensis]|uniref:Sugar ABC transporter permease n=1 Tax=Vallitalea pronyensis TaxID=1348613 RepID=A0A8J8MKU1_9FIRM|nr:sugar ABC transporter permease [Vallitalea pronyensis]QUI23585.1 sugar ABC transporter permease [Vallitalea pronyensis]
MGKKQLRITPKNAPYFFLAPAVILFLVFGVYPIIQTFIYSFMEKQGTITSGFVGLDNYVRAFNDKLFRKTLVNITIIFFLHAPLMIFFSLTLAHILNMATTKFKEGFRTLFFLPNVTNAVAYTFVFAIIMANDGILNEILGVVGIDPIPWLADPLLAKGAISVMIIWRWTGYNMVIFLAAMQNVDGALYEAADIAGASKLKQFMYITIPLMKNPIIFTTIMTVSGTLNLFAEAQLLANGGPMFGTYTPALLIYNTAWKQFDFGYASALSYLISVITIIIAAIQLRIGREKD